MPNWLGPLPVPHSGGGMPRTRHSGEGMPRTRHSGEGRNPLSSGPTFVAGGPLRGVVDVHIPAVLRTVEDCRC